MIDTDTKITRENVWANDFLKLEKVTFEDKDSKSHSHVRVIKKDAVAGLLYNAKIQKYIFVKQYRTGTDSDLIEIVAGTMDVEGESAEHCLAREILEETGYIMTSCKSICVSHTCPGVLNEKVHIFIAETDGEKMGDGGGVGNENIEIIEITFQEVMKHYYDLLKDMKTAIAILQHFGSQ